MERIYYVADSILRLVYINLLAIVFSFAGLVIFGFFPALVATFHLMRKWLMGESDLPITRTFIIMYKKSFIKSNLLGVLFVLIGSLLYINLSIAEVTPNDLVHLSYYPIYTILLIFLSCSLLIIPISLHYQVTFFSLLKHSFLLLFVRPFITALLLGSVVIFLLLLKSVPGLFLFTGISVFVCLVQFYSLKIFRSISFESEIDSV
ncbi:YesL family protein [Gracilibacillus xinjiangensis]|uniref:YesL family protein n=1 Tax=Gracilibacillus xinjiangensis TaxID=1193282 RepID=A0ABV8WVG1_9BACI